MKTLILLATIRMSTFVACGGASLGEGTARSADPQPDDVKLTWLSVTNWLLDAHVTRIDWRIVDAEGTSSAVGASLGDGGVGARLGEPERAGS